MNKLKNSGIYTRVLLCFTGILIAILLAVWLIVDTVCVQFIKEQRIQYNTQMIEKVRYECSSIYLQMNQLLNSLNNAKSTVPVDAVKEDTSVYERLKGQLEFEEAIKSIMYAYDYQGFVDGILFYYGEGVYYYVGQSVTSPYYPFSLKEYAGLWEEDAYTVLGPLQGASGQEEDSLLRFVLRSGQEWGEPGQDPGPFVMVEVRMEKMEERLEQVLSADNVYCLLDQQDYTVYSKGGSNETLGQELMELFPQVAREASKGDGNFSQGDVLITSVFLEEFGWILAVADSQDILFRDISGLTAKLEALIGICGLLGILAAVITSRKLFFPIRALRKIATEISEDKEITGESAKSSEVSQVIDLLKQMKARIQELNARQYILEVREQEAQLQMLQAQINPHFLHNTLDNIYCIAQIEEIEPIISLTRDLSQMMRYSVNNRQMFSTLRDEIQHVECYVGILNIRFENAIVLHQNIPEELMNARVIKLMLQPLVENACVHGILPRKNRWGNIWLSAFRKGGELIISVEDDGNGIAQELAERINSVLQKKVKSARTPKNKGFGIALVNVNDRIRLVDGDDYGLLVRKREEGGCIVLVRQRYASIEQDQQETV